MRKSCPLCGGDLSLERAGGLDAFYFCGPCDATFDIDFEDGD